MINGYDILYGLGLGISAPVWLLMPAARRKVLEALTQRKGHVPTREGEEPAVMIHAVSVGEMNATRAMVDQLRQKRPGLRFLITTTTITGLERAKTLYGNMPEVTVARFPLDFSPWVRRMLLAQRVKMAVLIELELWPNFLKVCRQMGIGVALVNGRITRGSHANFSRGKWLAKKMFGSLAVLCAQDEEYARQFKSLGAPADRVKVTGTMKFDTAQAGTTVAGADELAEAMGLGGDQPVWVCGSTGPGEEQVILSAYRALLAKHPTLRLVIVPRKPERFDEVAQEIIDAGFGLVRRSGRPVPGRSGRAGGGMPRAASDGAGTNAAAGSEASGPATPAEMNRDKPGAFPPAALSHAGPVVVLGDTMGELRKFYAIARVVFVGRTLVDLGAKQHGSDMIEPAALGKPVIVGPFTGNFTDVMRRFRASNAMGEIATTEQLIERTDQLLAGADQADAMGQRARQVVIDGQGATSRHVDEILKLLDAQRA